MSEFVAAAAAAAAALTSKLKGKKWAEEKLPVDHMGLPAAMFCMMHLFCAVVFASLWHSVNQSLEALCSLAVLGRTCATNASCLPSG